MFFIFMFFQHSIKRAKVNAAYKINLFFDLQLVKIEARINVLLLKQIY